MDISNYAIDKLREAFPSSFYIYVIQTLILEYFCECLPEKKGHYICTFCRQILCDQKEMVVACNELYKKRGYTPKIFCCKSFHYKCSKVNYICEHDRCDEHSWTTEDGKYKYCGEHSPSWWIVQYRIVPKALAIQLFKEVEPIVSLHGLQQPKFMFFSFPQGLVYKYFDTLCVGIKFTKAMKELARLATEILPQRNKTKFNALFINRYLPSDSIPSHRDNTHSKSPIVSFTIYGRKQKYEEDIRIFRIIADKNGKILDIPMPDRSGIIMLPGMQEQFKHEVLPLKTINEHDIVRLNFTFRVQ